MSSGSRLGRSLGTYAATRASTRYGASGEDCRIPGGEPSSSPGWGSWTRSGEGCDVPRTPDFARAGERASERVSHHVPRPGCLCRVLPKPTTGDPFAHAGLQGSGPGSHRWVWFLDGDRRFWGLTERSPTPTSQATLNSHDGRTAPTGEFDAGVTSLGGLPPPLPQGRPRDWMNTRTWTRTRTPDGSHVAADHNVATGKSPPGKRRRPE